MQVPLQITVRDLPHSDALDARIRDKAAKLGEFNRNIISGRVTVEELAAEGPQAKRVSVGKHRPLT